MKKIILLSTLLSILISCSPGGDDTNYTFELRPIMSVAIPTEFTLGQTYPITIRYNKRTTCNYFSTLYYEKNLNIRTIAIENAVAQRNNCEDLPNDVSVYTFNFEVTSNGSYIFKFYQGKNANGEPIFLEYEIPVTN